MVEFKQHTIHFNKPQLRVMALNCREQYVVAGRALGKSQGILAPHAEKCQRIMPLSCGMLLGSNYRKMLTDLIPPFISGLERLKLKRDRDFVVGYSDIPKKQNWKDPYLAPDKTMRRFFIHFKNGSGLRLASQDRKVTLNGTEVDYIMGDEAKLLNHERYQKEILPTNRGRESLWGHLPEHHSILFCTDKLFDRKGGSWIMDMKQKQDPALIEMILQLQSYIYTEEEKYVGQELPVEVDKKLTAYRKDLMAAQCVAVAFIEADTLENIHALGWNYIAQMKRNLSQQMFDIAIMNKDNVQVEGSFYPNLDYDKHGYDANNYSHIDNIGYDPDKLQDQTTLFDEDCNTKQPLEIAVDWGGSINGMVVCQDTDIEFKAINALYVKPPQTYKDLAIQFCNYYRFHKAKHVDMYYDPSGNNSRADSNETYAQEFSRILRENGWTVKLMNIGDTNPHYHDKHLLWQFILLETDKRFPIFRMNRSNCQLVFTSMINAPLKNGRNGFEKDKSSERKSSGILPEHATHFSDMLDIIIWFKYGNRLEKSGLRFSSPSIV
jgi:hypothetical protein